MDLRCESWDDGIMLGAYEIFLLFFFVQCTPLTLTLRQSDWSGYWFDLFLWSALNCCEVKSNGEWKYYGEVWNLKSHFSMTAIMTCLSIHSSLSNHSFNWTIFSTYFPLKLHSKSRTLKARFAPIIFIPCAIAFAYVYYIKKSKMTITVIHLCTFLWSPKKDYAA